MEQLKRAKARRLKEEQLKLENQIAEAEDAVELAKTKVQFYEELEDPLGGSISRANSVQDLNCEEPLKNIESKRIIKESIERDRELEIAYHKPKIKDEKTELQASLAEKSLPGTVPLFSSTPGGAAISEPCVKERSMNPEAAPFIYRALPHDRVCQPGSVSFPTPATETMMARLTTSIDSIVTKSSLPPLDVVKFSGNPCEYFRFKSRFEEMVDTQNISEAQKMSRLLQFLDGPARSAVAGFEGVPGGLGKALKMLQQRFGQPHIVAKACVDALVDGPNISNNGGQGLQEFADCSRSPNTLSEMNMSNLEKMSGKLSVMLQIKWRDKALRIRERKGFLTLEDLVVFIERRAEAANDPVFRRVEETKQFFQRRNPRARLQLLPPSLNAVPGPRQRQWLCKLDLVTQRNQIRIQIQQR